MPKNISLASMPSTLSRCWPPQAALPWRVCTTDLARSKVNAAAWPVPTVRSVTAGLVVATAASLYRVATAVAPFRVYLSAVPWKPMVSAVSPVPGAAVVSIFR